MALTTIKKLSPVRKRRKKRPCVQPGLRCWWPIQFLALFVLFGSASCSDAARLDGGDVLQSLLTPDSPIWHLLKEDIKTNPVRVKSDLEPVAPDRVDIDEQVSAAKLNVYGKPLQKCSTPHMALTGFTRDGRCVEQRDDVGSHHICIDLTTVGSERDFCQVTGQPDWCAKKGGCMGDRSKMCPRKHWCVCQWAFSAYIAKAGGCDKIQDVVCDAVNIEVLNAYKKRTSADGGKVSDALSCLKHKCPGISALQVGDSAKPLQAVVDIEKVAEPSVMPSATPTAVSVTESRKMQSNNNEAGLLIVVVISSTVGIASFLLFTCFRPSCPFLSPRRKAGEASSPQATEQLSFSSHPMGRLNSASWFRVIWRIADMSDDMFHSMGIDSMLYLHFTRQLFNLTGFLLIISCALLIPVYVSGSLHSNALISISIANVEVGSAKLLAPAVLVPINTILVLLFLDKCYKTFVGLAQRHLHQSLYVENFSVFIRNVPAQIFNSAQLFEWLSKLYPNEVLAAHLAVYDLMLVKMKRQHDLLIEELDKVQAKYQVTHVRPITKQVDSNGQVVDLDLIDVLQSASLAKEKELVTRRLQLLHFTSSSSGSVDALPSFDDAHTTVGFATFRRMQGAHMAAKAQVDSRPGVCDVAMAPDPRLILWEWLPIKAGRRIWRVIWVGAICAALSVGILVPVGLLASVGAGSTDESPYTKGFVSCALPVMVLYTLQCVLRPLLGALASREAHLTKDGLQKSVLWKQFYFLLLGLLSLCILPQLVHPLMDDSIKLPANGTATLEFLADSFVSDFVHNLAARSLKACAYVVFVGLCMGGFSLLRVGDFMLLVVRLRGAQSTAARNTAHQRYRTESIDLAMQYARHASVWSMCLVLSSVSPLMLVAAAVYLLVWYTSDKYNLLMIHQSQNRLGGKLAPASFDAIFVALLFYQALMCGIFILHKSMILSGAMLVAPVITLLAWHHMHTKYEQQASSIPHDLFSQTAQDKLSTDQSIDDSSIVRAADDAPDASFKAPTEAPQEKETAPFPPGYSYLHPALRD